jgi:flagellar biosynthesis protein FlhG
MIDQAQRLREIQSRSGNRTKTNSNIISVTSGKGGTGKSFISFYLAQFLALKGYKTLLVEFDHNLATLAFHLNIEPENTLLDIFHGTVLFEELPVKVKENLYIIFGESGKLQYPQNKLSYVQNFMQTLGKNSFSYDFIIIDNGAGINNEVFETIRASDLNLIVTLPDPVAVMDAYVLVKLMVKNSLRTSKGIVINKCLDDSEGKTTFNNLNKASLNFFNEELELMGIIGEAKPLQALQLLKTEDLANQPYSQVLKQFELIISLMVKSRQLANSHQSDPFKDSK